MSWRIVALGLLSLLLGLLLKAPADKLLPRLLPSEAGITLYEVEGRLLQGRAGQLSVRQQSIDDLSWSLSPWSLLLGRVTSSVQLSGGPAPLARDNVWLASELKLSLLSRQLELRDLRAAVNLEALQPLLKLSYLPLSGNLMLSLDELQIDLSQTQPLPLPSHLSGRLSLQQVQWKLGKNAALGDFHAQLSSDEDGSLQASIGEPGNEFVALRGDAQIKPDRSYALNLQLKPTAKTPANVANQMKALGRTDKQGWYTLRRSAQLPGL